MKRCVNSQFDETYFEETLENGLKVVIWKKEGYASTSAAFATHFGACDCIQQDEEKKEIKHPLGTAHFLEHKCFELHGKDVMELFSEMGVNVNAYTSYNETVYYFSCTNDEIAEPLNLLLDFVQDFNVSEQSVEKEKGIIIQEYLMYQQMPDNRLINEILKSMYHEHPLRYDIVGNEQTIKEITKEDLDQAYQLNYHPSNMLLVIVSGKDENEIMEVIRSNQEKKEFAAKRKIHRAQINESELVVQKEKVIEMDVSCNKVGIAYKLPCLFSDTKERMKREWSIRFVLENMFSSLNPKYQSWIDKKIISDTFSYDVDFSEDYAFLLFFNEDIQKEDFVDFIETQLKNPATSYEVIQQLKRRYFGQALRIFNSTEDIAVSVVRNVFEGVSVFDTLQILSKIDSKECQEEFSKLCLKNRAVVEIAPICENRGKMTESVE